MKVGAHLQKHTVTHTHKKCISRDPRPWPCLIGYVWASQTHRRQLLDVVKVEKQFFERTLVAVDLLRNIGQTAMTAIDVVDLSGTV